MARTAHARANDTIVIWEPQPRQAALIACPVFEVFYGGARGGGKTDGVLGDFISHADLYNENAIGLMVRRERTQLVETIERSRVLYGPLGWRYNEQDKMWRAPDGARLRFAYLERDADADAYQGHSYSRVYVEEIGTFPNERPILKLMATLRSGAGVPCGFRATGNPGGPGHHWVKRRYIDNAPLGWKITKQTFKNPWTGETVERDRVFIPSKLSDNRYLGNEYVANLQMTGSPQLVRAWLEGDWSVIEGAFFPEWSNEKHVIAPFAIPSDWLRFRSADWGSASPFSIGWWAVAGDALRIGERESVEIPRGALVRYREWYGAASPNVGLKLTADQVALGIVSRETSDKISYSVIDPSAFSWNGGPSIGERINGIIGVNGPFRPADNTRIAQRGAMGGWDQLRQRLKGTDGVPMIYCFSTCVDSIRTLPALQHDLDRPEDVDTENEDHAPDEWRYAVMSRPWVPSPSLEPKPTELLYEVKPDGRVMANMSVMDIVQAKMRKKQHG